MQQLVLHFEDRFTFSQTADPKANVFLQSFVQNGGGATDQFVLVDEVTYVSDVGNPSVEKGLNASGITGSFTKANVATVMNNLNVNNLIDAGGGEQYIADLIFDQPLTDDTAAGIDEILIFERGENSDLTIQAVDESRNLTGNAITLLREDIESLGFDIQTTGASSGASQPLGVWSVDLGDLGVSSLVGLRVSGGSGQSDPDIKVIGVHTIPEPASLALLGLGTLGLMGRRRRVVSFG